MFHHLMICSDCANQIVRYLKRMFIENKDNSTLERFHKQLVSKYSEI